MFIAALFTIATIWKQSKSPLTDKWIKKMWSIYQPIHVCTHRDTQTHTVECYAMLSHVSCVRLCDPIDGSHQAPCPWDAPGKSTGVGCHFLLHNGILLSRKKNEIRPFAATWMDLGIIILSEVSQTETDIV